MTLLLKMVALIIQQTAVYAHVIWEQVGDCQSQTIYTMKLGNRWLNYRDISDYELENILTFGLQDNSDVPECQQV